MDCDGGGFGVVYFIDGNGLQQSLEAMGTWIAYSRDVPKPKITRCTAMEAVRAAVLHGDKKPAEDVICAVFLLNIRFHTTLDRVDINGCIATMLTP